MLPTIEVRLAAELAARPEQVIATVKLLDDGATVPFIARYRKEATGGLDDTQLRLLDERLRYLRELEERRAVILASVNEQGKLSPELARQLQLATDKTTLEDLYLPYKPKRRTKAQMAREAGLEPLAEALLTQPEQDPESSAIAYLNAEAGFADTKAVLDGARQILMERMAEHAPLLASLRDYVWQNGELRAVVVEGKQEEGAKFADYFAHAEPIRSTPSHRALALLRGRNEGFLSVLLALPEDDNAPRLAPPNRCELKIAASFAIQNLNRPADKWLQDTVRLAWRAKLQPSLELELMNRLREAAETEAIQVFAANMKDLLLAAPAGPKTTLGLDPGLRTGVKVAVVDGTGKLLDTATIYPHAPRNDWQGSLATLAALCVRHQVKLVSIGNGTASRETDKLAQELIKAMPQLGLQKLVVSEAGASVYSASEFASKEFPELDVSLRGAVSIARRLQDPLAELVKIDPKAIGVGQYQHDVNQSALARSLDGVIEDCVNAVGVDVNTASVPLLTRVSGLSSSLANAIVAYRDQHGAFTNRHSLRKVPRLGDKTFEQAAGFLRVNDGDNPLDRSAVHPEAYPVVEQILLKTGQNMGQLLGDASRLRQLNPASFTSEQFGLPTVKDILLELEKPGRDPRPEFKTASFQDGVESLNDLRPDMVLEGVITNVTNFGAFVDIGVHQDGLVHISALADKFVKDPREVVKAGQVVKVKVLEVDVKRKRVALTMRLTDSASEAQQSAQPSKERLNRRQQTVLQSNQAPAAADNAMAAAFANLKRGR